MIRNRLSLLFILLLMMVAWPAVAQDATALDLTETYTSPDGRVSFDYPAEWVFEERELSEGEYVDVRLGNTPDVLDQFAEVFGTGLEPGQLYIEVAVGELNQVTDGLDGVTSESSMVEILELAFQAADSVEIQFGEIVALEIGGRPAARIDASPKDGGEGFVLLVDYGDNLIGGVAVGAATGELTDWEATVLAIIASIQIEAAGEATPEATATESAALDLTESVTTGNGLLTVQYPEGWLTRDSDDESVYIAPDEESLDKSFGNDFSSGQAEIMIGAQAVEDIIADMNLPLENDASPQKILQGAVKAAAAEGGITFDPVESVSIGDKRAARTRFTSQEFEGVAWAVEYQPGVIGLVQLLAAPDETAEWEATALAIAESAVYTG